MNVKRMLMDLEQDEAALALLRHAARTSDRELYVQVLRARYGEGCEPIDGLGMDADEKQFIVRVFVGSPHVTFVDYICEDEEDRWQSCREWLGEYDRQLAAAAMMSELERFDHLQGTPEFYDAIGDFMESIGLDDSDGSWIHDWDVSDAQSAQLTRWLRDVAAPAFL